MNGQANRFDGRDLAALLALAALAPLLLWRLAVAGQILQGPDAFAYFYPLYEYSADRLLEGQLPLWNPYLFLGAPFLANPQAGVFYPVHRLLASLPAPSLVSATLVLHYALAAAGMYLLVRLGLGRGRWAAIAAAAVYAMSGLLGAQVEHVNQVEALAWLPVQVLLLELGAVREGVPARRRRPLALAAAAITALQLFIGHTQAVYIAHATLLIYGALRPIWAVEDRSTLVRAWGRSLAFVAAMTVIGVGVAAVQLLPTLELIGLSVRSGGLDYRQAASFSFGPREWLLGLLPHYGEEAPYSEYVAYIGVIGLALAALGAARVGRPGRWMLALVAVGGFLALGGYNPIYYLLFRVVPGIDLFRAPARWLVVALLGASLLVAEGVDAAGGTLPRPKASRRVLMALLGLMGGVGLLWAAAVPRPEAVTVLGWGAAAAASALTFYLARPAWRPPLLVLMLLGELAVASSVLPFNQTTAAQVYESERRTTQVLYVEGGLGRYLSVTDPTFDSGDMNDVLAALGEGLSAEGRYGLLVGAKWQEVLARNLALHWRLHAVDGYDGGVLPTADYIDFQELLLGTGKAAADGRLSEALETVPQERLLALAGVEYLLTDRLQDLWLEGIYYDLSAGVALRGGAETVVVDLPPFVGDAMGLVVDEGGDTEAADGPAGEIVLDDSVVVSVWRREGRLWALGPDGLERAFAPVPDRDGFQHASVTVAGEARHFARLAVAPLDAGEAVLRAVSLVNSRTGTGAVVELNPLLTTLNLGDVRLQRFEATLPRAYFAACVTYSADREAALARLAQSDFDPREELVVVGEGSSACPQPGWQPVAVVEYLPERVVLEVDAPFDGFVVLLDSHYPGWEASVDGRAADVERANWFFRAVPVSAGAHQVEMVYRPPMLRLGGVVSLASTVTLALGLLVSVRAARKGD